MSDEDFELWLAKEKKAASEARYAENWADFDRIKSRLGAVLTLSITLTTASAAVTFSHSSYSFVGGYLVVGFVSTAVLCVKGLYSSPILSKNFAPDVIDDLTKDIPAPSETHGLLRMADAITVVNWENCATLDEDRYYLRAALWVLVSTPAVACIAALGMILG